MTTEQLKRTNELVYDIGVNGNRTSLDELYLLIRKPLYCSLIKYYKDHYEIEDIIMETIGRIIKKSSNLLHYNNCYAWIKRISNNILRNHLRKQGRRNELFNCIPFETHVKYNEQKHLLKMEIEKLPEYNRYLIFYKFYCKFKIGEIAKKFNCSKAKINRDIKETLEILKEKLYEKD